MASIKTSAVNIKMETVVKIKMESPAGKEDLVKSRCKKRSGRRIPQNAGGTKRPLSHSGKSGWRPSIAEWRESVTHNAEAKLEIEELAGKVTTLQLSNEELEGNVVTLQHQARDHQQKAETYASTAQAMIEARKEIDELKASKGDLTKRLGKLAQINQDLQINLDWTVQMSRQELPPPTLVTRRGKPDAL